MSLTYALVGDDWSVSLSGCFTPEEKVPGIEDWPSVVQPAASRYIDRSIPALNLYDVLKNSTLY
jgi:hypothetical protein